MPPPRPCRQVGSDLLGEEVLCISFPVILSLLTMRGTWRWLCPGTRGLAGRCAVVGGLLCGPQGLGLTQPGSVPEQGATQGAGDSPQGQPCPRTALTSRVTAQEKRSIVEWMRVGRISGFSLAGGSVLGFSPLPSDPPVVWAAPLAGTAPSNPSVVWAAPLAGTAPSDPPWGLGCTADRHGPQRPPCGLGCTAGRHSRFLPSRSPRFGSRLSFRPLLALLQGDFS